MVEFEEGGNAYRVGKLNAFQQFHLSRRVAPLVPKLVPLVVKMAREGGLKDDIAGTAELMQPFADALGGMADADAEYILSTCLSVVQRDTGGTWAAVWNAQARSCMFDDIDLGLMFRLSFRVLQDSLGPFIRGLLTSPAEQT